MLKHVKSVASVLAAGLLASVLSACGGGGGYSSGGNNDVSVSLSKSTIVLGDFTVLSWSDNMVDDKCVASGDWPAAMSFQPDAGAKVIAGNLTLTPTAVGTYTYSLSCTGKQGTTAKSATLTVQAIPQPGASVVNNVVPITLDAGPTGQSINTPFVTVTVCEPSTNNCSTVDHVIVDTGSVGLRVLAPALSNAAQLPKVGDSKGNAVGECAQFASGFAWGAVRHADIRMAGELASNVPMEVVADADALFARTPDDCAATGGADLSNLKFLGAKGILGVGLFTNDCGAACAQGAIAATYYSCNAGGCVPTALPLESQVAHPVSRFTSDNNGVVVSLPGVAPLGATKMAGSLIFGIDTQLNNQLASMQVYPTSATGMLVTNYNGKTLKGFLDTGSNGLFFTDLGIAMCSTAVNWYCPATSLSLTAQIYAQSGPLRDVALTLQNMEALPLATVAAIVGGPGASESLGFDWGLPFFFNRPVATAIQGHTTSKGVGPFVSF